MSATISNAIAPVGAQISAFDTRLVEIDIVLPTQTITFTAQNPGLTIRAIGSIFGSPTQNSCECQIFNLTRELRNTIITLASPLLNPPINNPAYGVVNPPAGDTGSSPVRAPVILTLKAGRKSIGMATIFTGNVISCEMTQPPDIAITLRSLTNNYLYSQLLDIAEPENTSFSSIAATVAAKNGNFIDFEATDKQVANFVFDPIAGKNIEKLRQIGGVQVGVDASNILWVIDANAVRKNTGYTLTESTGMVGIPQVTSEGVVVRMMINSAIIIGGQITISSVINPAANGTFRVMKIDYELASRDKPFWYTLLCQNMAIYSAGNVG